MSGKCPACQQRIANVDLKGPHIGNSVFGPIKRGFVAVCPRCQTILGVVPDTTAIAAEVVEMLQNPKRRTG